MLTLYGFPRSRSTRVLWMLEELGVDYRYCKVDLGAGEGQQPAYLALNPAGKVPTLMDDNFVLTESVAILTYLGDRFPELGLIPPAGSHDRARYLQWACFVLSELEQPLWTIAKHRFALPKEHRVAGIFETAVWEFERAATVLRKGLGEKDFLVGENFSAADILAAHTLAWAEAFKLPPTDPVLADYSRRQLGRPAWQRARTREAEA